MGYQLLTEGLSVVHQGLTNSLDDSLVFEFVCDKVLLEKGIHASDRASSTEHKAHFLLVSVRLSTQGQARLNSQNS